MAEWDYLNDPISLYRAQENAFALAALSMPVDVPAPDLGIGETEKHDSLGVGLQYPIEPDENPVQPAAGSSALELANPSGQGPVLSPADFPHEFYYGDPLGGL